MKIKPYLFTKETIDGFEIKFDTGYERLLKTLLMNSI